MLGDHYIGLLSDELNCMAGFFKVFTIKIPLPCSKSISLGLSPLRLYNTLGHISSPSNAGSTIIFAPSEIISVDVHKVPLCA